MGVLSDYPPYLLYTNSTYVGTNLSHKMRHIVYKGDDGTAGLLAAREASLSRPTRKSSNNLSNATGEWLDCIYRPSLDKGIMGRMNLIANFNTTFKMRLL